MLLKSKRPPAHSPQVGLSAAGSDRQLEYTGENDIARLGDAHGQMAKFTALVNSVFGLLTNWHTFVWTGHIRVSRKVHFMSFFKKKN